MIVKILRLPYVYVTHTIALIADLYKKNLFSNANEKRTVIDSDLIDIYKNKQKAKKKKKKIASERVEKKNSSKDYIKRRTIHIPAI